MSVGQGGADLLRELLVYTLNSGSTPLGLSSQALSLLYFANSWMRQFVLKMGTG